MIFKSIQEFRAKATDTDKQALFEYVQSLTKKVDGFPNDIYNFSYSSASRYLTDEGYLTGKPKGNSDKRSITEFIIHTPEPKEFISRSVTLQTDIIERLDKLADDNWQYSKKAVINKLLDEALARYGY